MKSEKGADLIAPETRLAADLKFWWRVVTARRRDATIPGMTNYQAARPAS